MSEQKTTASAEGGRVSILGISDDAKRDPFSQPFQNPFVPREGAFGDLPGRLWSEHDARARRFHIGYPLWLALQGVPVDDPPGETTVTVQVRAEEMRDALWPFDDVTIVPRNAPAAPFIGDPQGRTYRQGPIGFAKRKVPNAEEIGHPGAFMVQVIDTYASGTSIVKDPSFTAFYRNGSMSNPLFPALVIGGRTIPFPESERAIQVRQVLINFAGFTAFCDMLRYCGSMVEVRHLYRGKAKRTTLEMVARQNYRDVEIVLSPKLTVYEIGERVTSGRIGYERAHPRRHDVREHLRVLSDGRIVIVSAHERGGISGPGPAYNCGPISRWYTQRVAEGSLT